MSPYYALTYHSLLFLRCFVASYSVIFAAAQPLSFLLCIDAVRAYPYVRLPLRDESGVRPELRVDLLFLLLPWCFVGYLSLSDPYCYSFDRYFASA